MYKAPLQDLAFVLHELIGQDALAGCPAFADYSAELADAVLAESARFSENVLAPLNRSGDREGAHWRTAGVRAPAGFREAYRQFVDGGWPQLRASAAQGGQGAPLMLATAVQETWASANLAFKLCPMLSYGATDALTLRATPALQRMFVPPLVSGRWTGTMVLTEPQAGSDLGLIRTRAVPEGDHYRLFGQKIFITWGEHDFTDNIVHMVLARIEGAPEGVRGISMFIVPKVLIDEAGKLGEHNDVRCVSIEHKLGIRASPTCVMAFGEGPGAVGYLVGEAHRGLEYMFIMMNAARLAVGLQGYAVAELAFQQAAEYARGRLQGRAGAKGAGPAAIIQHADVKRMLLTMKAGTEAMRALTLYTAWQLDVAEKHAEEHTRTAAQARADLLIPIVKGWCTELGIEIASLGIQVHGGMGFIEETGAAQLLRDVRITAIYEGTTGIQANDLLGRKLARDQGAAMETLLEQIRAELTAAPDTAAPGTAVPGTAMAGIEAGVESVRRAALEAVGVLQEATATMLRLAAQPERAAAVGVPYLKLCGYALGGWLMARAALLALSRLDTPAPAQFYRAKIITARAYAGQLLPNVLALMRIIGAGADCISEAEPGAI